ncbi:MAG: hypothetical protein DI624_04075 [Brevundimonas sp.]|uniref:helix-turn-helix domain-containing protein n=1 Tax=Brevundimonas sp. TaxID=1871086 RepID=UPI000DB6CC54|nr:helix-turn-helix domain-containing protein [Brevundimonas sp.]PZT99857.1 MAG: hypothetical protein DI624_04075 [Brevundimonas sp.]
MTLHASTPGDYAAALLQRGYSVQAVSMICGMHVDQVRPMEPLRPRRIGYTPPPTPPLTPVLVAAPAGQSPREAQMSLIEGVASRYGLRSADLISRRHSKRFAWARHEAMAAIKARFGLSYPRIGALFGGRDHTTVIAGVRAYETRRAWCDVVMAMARAP